MISWLWDGGGLVTSAIPPAVCSVSTLVRADGRVCFQYYPLGQAVIYGSAQLLVGWESGSWSFPTVQQGMLTLLGPEAGRRRVAYISLPRFRDM